VFELETSFTEITFESYRMGADYAYKKVEASKACDYQAKAGDKSLCKAEVEKTFMESVEDVLQGESSTPTAEQWEAADLWGIQNFYYNRDFLRYHGLLEGTVSTLQEFEDAAQKLCNMTLAQASEKKENGEHHKWSAPAYLGVRCFGATYAAYLLKRSGIPATKSIGFLDVNVDWSIGYLRKLAKVFTQSLEPYSDVLSTPSGAFSYGLTVVLAVLAFAEL
jgi:hypothetical protein